MTSSHLNGQATGTPDADKVYLEEETSATHKFGDIVRGISWIGLGLAFRVRPPLGAN